MQFEEFEWDGHKYLAWRGVHTYGGTTMRGTHIMVHPPAVVLFYNDTLDPDHDQFHVQEFEPPTTDTCSGYGARYSALQYRSPDEFLDEVQELRPVYDLPQLKDSGCAVDLKEFDGLLGNVSNAFEVVLAPPDTWPGIVAEITAVSAYGKSKGCTFDWF